MLEGFLAKLEETTESGKQKTLEPLKINIMRRTLKSILTLSLLSMALFANAQIKVHPDSHVSIGTLSDSWDVGVHIYPPGWTVFNTQSTNDWHWVTVATPGAATGKCWIVTCPKNKYAHTFFVTGSGDIYARGSWRASDSSLQTESEQIRNAGSTIDELTGIWYTPINDGCSNHNTNLRTKRVGVCAQEVEKVLPEAVAADENGLLYVDYEAFTVFLIQAVKEQRQEIREMRKILEENGLIK